MRRSQAVLAYWLAWMGVGICPDTGLLAQETAAVSPAEPGQMESPAIVPPPSEPDARPSEPVPIEELSAEQLEAALLETQQALVVLQEPPTTDPPGEDGLDEEQRRQRITLLQDLENVLQRRLSAQARLRELRRSVADLEEEGPDASALPDDVTPPYELALLDSLRDELDTTRRTIEGLQLSLESAEQNLTQMRQRLGEAETNRRRVRDELNAVESDAVVADVPTTDVPWELLSARLLQEIVAHEWALASTRVASTRVESRIQEIRQQRLEAGIAAVEGQVRFERRDLERRLAELEGRRSELETELRALRRLDQANQVRLSEARERLQAARGEDQIRLRTEAVAAREMMAEGTRRGIELLQERINNIARFTTLWEYRFGLQGDPSQPDIDQWRAATLSISYEIERRRLEVDQRLSALRTTVLELENRLAAWDPETDGRDELERRVQAMRDIEDHARRYLASLLELDQLSNRVLAEIEQVRVMKTWADYYSRAFHRIGEIWNYELFVIDDRAFRIGQLLRSVILFHVLLLLAWIGRFFVRRYLIRQTDEGGGASAAILKLSVLPVIQRTQRVAVIFFATYLALVTLPLSPGLRSMLHSAVLIVVTIQAAIWANASIQRYIERTKQRRAESDPSAASAFGLMGFFAKVALWSAVLLLALTNLGYEIGPLLAGLGVGGVAVAFALQNILGDIFCSIAIVLDKPFVVGDFVIVDDILGTVENIGIKTTRIRSLSGEEVVISNADLLGSRVRNYKRMYQRRVVFGFGVMYETPAEKLEQIPETIREIIENIPRTRFDRAHFHEYGDFSLNFEVVYFVNGPDYNVFMDIQQRINLEMLRAFRQADVSFAYPTREIIVRPNAAALAS